MNCYSLADVMKELRGWDLATLQSPPAIHLALTLPTSANADAFIADLRRAVHILRAEPAKYAGGSAGLYGTAAKMPAGFVEESAKVYLDTMTACATAPVEEANGGAAKAHPAAHTNGAHA